MGIHFKSACCHAVDVEVKLCFYLTIKKYIDIILTIFCVVNSIFINTTSK